MDSENLWLAKKRENPAHAATFMARFATLRSDGADLDGEARFVDALVGRSARILDAGCGMGRVGGELARRGHHVTGMDLDDELIEAARQDYPGCDWRLGDLTTLSIPEKKFEVIVCAGNVMAFLTPGSAPQVLTRFREHLVPGGRAVIGFGAGRGYAFEDFFADAEGAGLAITGRFSTWQLHPRQPDSDFLVAVLTHPVPAG